MPITLNDHKQGNYYHGSEVRQIISLIIDVVSTAQGFLGSENSSPGWGYAYDFDDTEAWVKIYCPPKKAEKLFTVLQEAFNDQFFAISMHPRGEGLDTVITFTRQFP